jgi:Na+/H+-translocating membrane pyrophosphatase
MVAPGCLVIGAPFVVGILFGTQAVAGLLAGIIVSGVQVAISSSNTGGAWDNCKKYIENGTHLGQEPGEDGRPYVFKKHSDAHTNAVIGDTVGDPLKDTSGPSINILIKLSAITSLVFGSFFAK